MAGNWVTLIYPDEALYLSNVQEISGFVGKVLYPDGTPDDYAIYNNSVFYCPLGEGITPDLLECSRTRLLVCT